MSSIINPDFPPGGDCTIFFRWGQFDYIVGGFTGFWSKPAETQKGKVGISFLPEQGEQAACELQIHLDILRAQFGPGSLNRSAANEKSLREGGAPHSAHNYAIGNLIGVDKPFTVRVIVKAGDKIGGSLIDAEIAAQRTMISYRPDLIVRKLLFRLEGLALKDVQIAPLRAKDWRAP